MRIKNENIDRKKLFLQLVKNIRRNNLSFKTIIRSFSKYITDLRDGLLKKVSLELKKQHQGIDNLRSYLEENKPIVDYFYNKFITTLAS